MILNRTVLSASSRSLVVSCTRRNMAVLTRQPVPLRSVACGSRLQNTRGFFGSKSDKSEETKTAEKPQDEGIKQETDTETAQSTEDLTAQLKQCQENSAAQQEQIKALEQKLKESEEKVKQEHSNFVRALADMENVRRIAAKDVDNSKKFALTGFAKEILEVADNLSRAIQFVPENVRSDTQGHPELANFFEGVAMTENILQGVLKKKGITRYVPQVGDKFDPNVHMATFKVQSDKFEEGTVAHCMTDGYMIHERVLRAAVVGVHEKPQAE